MSGRIRMQDVTGAVLALVFAVGQMAAGFAPDLLGWEVSIASRSAQYDTLLIPAWPAFLLWPVLFLGNIAFALYALMPAQLRDPLVRSLTWPAAAAFAANTVRSVYEPLAGPDWISLVMFAAILVPLLFAAWRIAKARPLRGAPRWLLWPVTAQAGWISVAFAAAFSQMALFEGINPSGLSAESAALATLGVWLIPAAVLAYVFRSPAYALAMMWGLVWIAGGLVLRDAPELAWAALAALIVLAGALAAGRRPTGHAQPA